MSDDPTRLLDLPRGAQDAAGSPGVHDLLRGALLAGRAAASKGPP